MDTSLAPASNLGFGLCVSRPFKLKPTTITPYVCADIFIPALKLSSVLFIIGMYSLL